MFELSQALAVVIFLAMFIVIIIGKIPRHVPALIGAALTAITHYEVRERIASQFGKLALVDVRIETGRTHQIRVHMSSIGHPVVGDSLYRAPKELRRPPALRKGSTKATSRGASQPEAAQTPSVLTLKRNFLHAAVIEFTHPRSGEPLSFSAPLPPDLTQLLEQIRG